MLVCVWLFELYANLYTAPAMGKEPLSDGHWNVGAEKVNTILD